MISRFQHMISYIWFHRFQVATMIWYILYDFFYIIYDILYTENDFRCDKMKSYLISSTSLHKDRHKDSPVSLHAWAGCQLRLCRMISALEPIDSRVSAVSDSWRFTSIFAGSVSGAGAGAGRPRRQPWRLTVSPAVSQQAVTVHSDTARMPLRFIIYRTWRPGWPVHWPH